MRNIKIDTSLVQTLLHSQFPQWANLPINQILPGGWDNRTFRLGTEMLVRLPSNEAYSAQVQKEQTWLPILAKQVPLKIPKPVAMGSPSKEYPWAWSVYEWIDGEPTKLEVLPDIPRFAIDVAGFLANLHNINSRGGPPPGTHNFYRAGDLKIYDQETKNAIHILKD